MTSNDIHVITTCPFCQSENLTLCEEDGHWWVQCIDCHARGARSESREEAQFGWIATSGNQQLLRLMIDASPSSFVVKDIEGRFVFVNKRFAEFFRREASDIVGYRDEDFIDDPRLAAFFRQTIQSVFDSGEAENLEEAVIDPFNGKTRWFHSHKLLITLGADRKPLALMVTHEITELKQAHQQLMHKERRFLEAMMASGEAIWESDSKSGQIVFSNDRIADILTLPDRQKAFTLEEFRCYVHSEDIEAVDAAFLKLLPQRGEAEFQHRLVATDGRVVWVRNRVQVVERDADNQAVRLIGSIRDVTERKEAEQHLEQIRQQLEQTNSHLENLVEQRTSELVQLNLELQSLARIDSLTGLSNRLAADETLSHEFARMKRGQSCYMVMLADVDHFKSVNDTWGHAVGDKALMHIAGLLRSSLRETDMVARYGGEEFLILLHTDNQASAHQLAEGMRRLVEVTPLATDICVTISVGLAAARETDHSPGDATRRADEKLYEAKAAGRNRVRQARP